MKINITYQYLHNKADIIKLIYSHRDKDINHQNTILSQYFLLILECEINEPWAAGLFFSSFPSTLPSPTQASILFTLGYHCRRLLDVANLAAAPKAAVAVLRGM